MLEASDRCPHPLGPRWMRSGRGSPRIRIARSSGGGTSGSWLRSQASSRGARRPTPSRSAPR
eukprot:14312311-Alexandrium_andersonii.AAC.1